MYAIFGGIVWSAYEEFGNQSLLDMAPLVAADRAPLKLLPGEDTQDRVALPTKAGKDRPSATALAPGGRPVLPLRDPALPTPPSLEGGQESEADTLVLTKRPALAPHEMEPDAAVEATGAEASVTAALETPPLDVRAAAPPPAAAPTAVDEDFHSGPAATWPPAPTFKPLDAVPVVVAQAVLAPPKDSATARSRLGVSPPVPSLKPIVRPSEQRPGQPAEEHTRVAAASGPASLPDALRAFWANLKILLASGPAPRVVPAGGNNSDRRPDRSGGGGGSANAGTGGGGGTTGGGGSGATGDGAGSSTSGGSGGSNSGSGGSTDGGGGNGSTSGGGSGGKGDGGKGGGKAGKGGGKGDGGKGGGKGGRGGDDDDDDDD